MTNELLARIELLEEENQELKKQLEIKHNGFMASVEEACELAKKNQKYKEVIDKAILELANIDGNLSNSQLSDRICNLIDILKEVE